MKHVEILGAFVCFCVHHVLAGGGPDGCKLNFFSKCFGTEFYRISDPESVRKVCKQQTLRAAMVCVDDMKSSCEAELRQTIDTTGWSDAMKLYCQHVDLMADNSHCTKAAGPEIKACVSSLLVAFRQKMVTRNMTMMSDPRLIMQLTCEHTEETMECFGLKLAKTCPDDVRDILSRVSKLLTTAACPFGRYVDTTPTDTSLTNTDDRGENRGSNIGASLLIIITVLCLFRVS